MGSLQYADSLNERSFQGVGGNPITAPAQLNVTHETRVDDSTQRALAPYTAASNMEASPYMGWPRTHDTLAFAHRADMELLGQMMQVHEESFDGWWFKFAARNRTNMMRQWVKILITDPAVMEPASELTVPGLLQFKEEQYAISMQRYHQGFDILSEHFMEESGRQELALKVHMFMQNAILTQKLLVMAAAIDAEEIMFKQYRRNIKFRDIEHFTRHERTLMGCIQKDPAALQKILSFLDLALSRNPRKPRINMAVLSKKAFHQLRFAHPRNMEVYRAGQEMVNRVMGSGTSQEFAQGLLPYPLYADEKVDPINSQGNLPLEALRRQATIGSYAILQHDDEGPVKGGGYGNKMAYSEPTIECVTQPHNDFTQFTMTEMLDNDVRFDDDEDGTITRRTQQLIDNEGNYSDPDNNRRAPYGRKHHVKDMFVYQPNILPGHGHKNADAEPRVCQRVGEMDLVYLPGDFMAKQARRAFANCGLTENELHQISLYLEAANDLFTGTAPTEAQLKAMMWQFANGKARSGDRDTYVARADVQPEPVWGGPLVHTQSELALGTQVNLVEAVTSGTVTPAVPLEKPYGCADIQSLLSITSQAKDFARSFPEWRYSRMLDYSTCKSGMDKITRYQARSFYKCGLNDATVLPRNRMVNDMSRNAVLASLRGPFERAKHGLWLQYSDGDDRTFRNSIPNWTGSANQYAERAYRNAQAVAPNFSNWAQRSTAIDSHVAGFYKAYPSYNIQAAQTFVVKIVQDLFDTSGSATEVDANEAAAVAIVIEHVFNLLLEDRYEVVASLFEVDAVTSKYAKLQPIFTAAKRAVVNLRLKADAFDNPVDPSATAVEPGMRRPLSTVGKFRVTRLVISKDQVGADGKIGAFFGTNAAEGADAPIPERTGAGDALARARMTPRMSVYDGDDYKAAHPEITGTFRDGNQQMDARRTRAVGGAFQVINDYIYDDNNNVAQKSSYLAECQHMATRVSLIQSAFPDDNSAENAICRYFAYSMAFLPINRRAFKTLVANNLYVPGNYSINWYAIRLNTQALLLAEGGPQTCRLNYNWVQTTVPNDAAHRMVLYNMSAWMGAKVIDPSKVIIIPDVGFDGYLGGMGKTFVRSKADMQGKNRKDIIAMMVPITMTRDMAHTEEHNPIPLFGMHDRDFYNGTFDNKDWTFRREPRFSTWTFYNHFFQFHDNMNPTADKPLFANFRELRDNRYNPGTLWLRRTRSYNSATGHFDYQRGTKGTGHLDAIDPERQNMRATLDGEIEMKDSSFDSRGF